MSAADPALSATLYVVPPALADGDSGQVARAIGAAARVHGFEEDDADPWSLVPTGARGRASRVKLRVWRGQGTVLVGLKLGNPAGTSTGGRTRAPPRIPLRAHLDAAGALATCAGLIPAGPPLIETAAAGRLVHRLRTAAGAVPASGQRPVDVLDGRGPVRPAASGPVYVLHRPADARSAADAVHRLGPAGVDAKASLLPALIERVRESRAAPGSFRRVLWCPLPPPMPFPPDLVEAAWALEARGVRFKIATPRMVASPDGVRTLAFDLESLAGARWWVPELPDAAGTAYLGLDAGHDPACDRSRWAAALVTLERGVVWVHLHDARRNEALGDRFLDEIRAGLGAHGAPFDRLVVHRDGRFMDGQLEQRRLRDALGGLARAVSVIGITKHPGLLLHRAGAPARVGDVARLADGRVLLQTISEQANSASEPLAIALGSNEDRDRRLAEILALLDVPGPALYHRQRLPHSIWAADGASSLDHDGWPKVVGRGWGLRRPAGAP